VRDEETVLGRPSGARSRLGHERTIVGKYPFSARYRLLYKRGRAEVPEDLPGALDPAQLIGRHQLSLKGKDEQHYPLAL
jgi:hypothetical protein